MADNPQAINSVKFIGDLVTCLRLISIYPPKHPLIVNSLKNFFASLNLLFAEKKEFNLSLSPDNTIIVDGEALSEKSSGLAQDFAPYFKKLEIEDVTFRFSVTESEIEQFVKILILDKETFKNYGDINKLFQEKGITHLQAKQFSYLKVEKGKEVFVAEGKRSDFEQLKVKIKDFSEKKIEKLEDVQQIEKEIFELARDEFKQTQKLSAQVKSALKKFIIHHEDKDSVLSRLKEALVEYGCPIDDVGRLLGKISEEISRPQETRTRVSVADFAELKKENENLKSKSDFWEKEVSRHAAAVEQLKKENIRIISEKQRIDNIIRNMAEGMVVVDSDGKILMVNPAAESLLGITKSDIGRFVKDVVKNEHLLTLTKQIPVKKDDVVEEDIEMFSADESSKKVLRASSAVVEDHNGNTVGMVTMLNDITKQKEIEEIKSQFVANVSHELRTPLIAIEKSVSLILNKGAGEISGTQNEFLSIAERNLKRLSLLINDLLDLSKLEARKTALQVEKTDLGKLIVDSVESLKNWAATKSIKLSSAIGPDVPLIGLDSNKIIQVLNNLIGNAIKFTPENGIIIVEAARDKKEGEVLVSVQDTGVGMDPQDLGKIFDKFFQVTDKKYSDIKGTGIGLAIVKEIVELHKGRVWVESEKGKGARFIFALPIWL
ncbi:MAG: ATP-binding protein [Candidatus Omnitrophota bacterium]